MPSPKRVRWAQLRVGILAMGALIITAVLIFLLTSNTKLFEGRFYLRTYMEDSAAMAESSPVRLNGIMVGNIEHIRLTGEKDPKRIVMIEMSVMNRYLDEIPEDSVAGISAANLLGDKFINITKGRSSRHVSQGGEVRSQDVIDIPQLLAQSATILTQFQGIVGKADALLSYVNSGQGNVGLIIKDDKLYKQVNETAAELNQIVHDVHTSQGTLSKLIYSDQLYNDVRRPIQRIDDMLAELQAGHGSAGKLLKDDALYDEARQSLTEAHKMLDDLNAGKGTAGKLLKDEDLYRQVDAIVAKVNTAIDKINAGQGTIGQLVVNPQLYDALNGTMKEAQALVKDIHANPKKFLRIKLALF
jgi:phospholipid/cholesterol/gamma-HCH transport system substrate-binding protein